MDTQQVTGPDEFYFRIVLADPWNVWVTTTNTTGEM